jgi:hypothetical protein
MLIKETLCELEYECVAQDIKTTFPYSCENSCKAVKCSLYITECIPQTISEGTELASVYTVKFQSCGLMERSIVLIHSVPALLGSVYLNAQPRVFKSQGRLKHPLGNKIHILRDISFNLWQTETWLFQHTFS